MPDPLSLIDATPQTLAFPQCLHVFTDGRRCGAPSLRGDDFCYFHNHVRFPRADIHPALGVPARFAMPAPESLLTPEGIQLALGEALQAIATDQVMSRTGALLLHGLQIAISNLGRISTAPHQPKPPYEKISA